MTVSDESPYSIADAMIWAVLQDTSHQQGQNLLAWRKQQRQDGHPGKDFDEGEIPPLPESGDRPSLLLVTTAPVVSAEQGQLGSVTTRKYEITIMGHLDVPEHRENDGDKKIKRFQHLVELVVGKALRDLRGGSSKYVPAGETNPITDVQPGGPVLPDWRYSSTDNCFEWPITLTLEFGPVWLA